MIAHAMQKSRHSSEYTERTVDGYEEHGLGQQLLLKIVLEDGAGGPTSQCSHGSSWFVQVQVTGHKQCINLHMLETGLLQGRKGVLGRESGDHVRNVWRFGRSTHKVFDSLATGNVVCNMACYDNWLVLSMVSVMGHSHGMLARMEQERLILADCDTDSSSRAFKFQSLAGALPLGQQPHPEIWNV